MSADSVPSSKFNMFQSKLYTLVYCRHFRTYSRCAMFDWSDTVFRRRNVTRRRISTTVLQPRYWGSEADSPEVGRLMETCITFNGKNISVNWAFFFSFIALSFSNLILWWFFFTHFWSSIIYFLCTASFFFSNQHQRRNDMFIFV